MRSNKKHLPWISVFPVLYLLVVLAKGCTDPISTTRVLEQQGYTSIEVTGWRPFTRDKNDWYSTGFKAVSPSGEVVTGAVTKGFFKGNTVRLD